MIKRPLCPDEETMRTAWNELKRRPIMFESVLIVLVTMLDIWWTLYVVRAGLAIEANPLMAWALDRGNGMFVGIKVGYLLPALVVFEWVRGVNPMLARFAANASLWGYVGFYTIATLKLHHII